MINCTCLPQAATHNTQEYEHYHRACSSEKRIIITLMSIHELIFALLQWHKAR